MAAALLGLSNSPFFVIEAFFYALLGGLLPALLWMWFWMHESYSHNEPKNIIALTFVAGMACVFLVYPFQQLIPRYIFGLDDSSSGTLLIWAFLEEAFKFGAAYFCAFKIKAAFDEPLDAFIYLMTAALGFTAMENTFYLLAPLLQGDTIGSIVTGNSRFMGASLLHVVASGALSVFIAYAFYKSKWIKRTYWLVGLLAATVLHTLFNYFIIITTEDSSYLIFSFVWLTTIILIAALEKVKMIKKF
jgi:RsiW-degrading membrane proteinase PrsW (M82 family)